MFDIFGVMPHLVKTQGPYCFALLMKADQISTFTFNFVFSRKTGRVSMVHIGKLIVIQKHIILTRH